MLGLVLFFLLFSSMYQKTLTKTLKKCEIQQVNYQLPRKAIALSSLVSLSVPGKTWRSVQWEQWFLTLRQISTLGAVTLSNIPSIWAVGINDLYLRECENSQSETDLAIPHPLSWRRARTVLSECSRPYQCLHKPTANLLPRLQISPVPVVRPLECSVSPFFQGSTHIGLEHKQSSWEHSAHWTIRELEATGVTSRRRAWGWNTHSKERERCRVLKDGSSWHAAYQQGVKRK